ncbi:nucleotide exchange factor GrpE [Candidatus Uhrbacteria bacterium]|nr:nucleotide exchange factor GrpE [Candidatus Uhrbacteria bacterium]
MSDELQQDQEQIEPTESDEATPKDDLQKKCEEYLNGWRRAQADYANLKRESERERMEHIKYANERLLSELLPAIDQFDIALDFIPETSTLTPEEKKKWDNWLLGIRAVRSLWEGSFQAIGLEHVPTNGAFDPNQHEAVGEEEHSDTTTGNIVRTTQSGWRLNGKLLRPAKVIVAK